LVHGQEEYLLKCTSPPSAAAAALEAKTRAADWKAHHAAGETKFLFSDCWTTDVVEAKTLAMFAAMLKARRVLEIGMFTGYGALTIAEALPADGEMITFEIDPFLERFARPVFDASPHGSKIDVKIGDALANLKAWPADKKFDMVFVDADKGSYQAYYDTVLDRGLLAPGGVVVVDNVLFKGAPYVGPSKFDNRSWNDGGAAVAAFNDHVAADDRVEQVMLPIRDGITIIRLKDQPALAPVAAAAAPVVAQAPEPVVVAPPAPPAVEVASDAVVSGVGNKPILDRMRLDGKAALVTGAGQGIGRAFAHALAEAGAAVCVADLDLDRAKAVAAELEAKGARAYAHKADCGDPAAIACMVDTVVEKFGAIDIAVNNAGVNKNSAAEDTPLADWDLTFNLNTRGVFLCCQAEAKHMLAKGCGKIINTASMASLLVPHPQKQAAYNCSKAAVVKLTQSLACEWAGRGLNVNCVSPGIVDTPLIWDNPALNKLADQWLAQIPANRLAQVTDLQAAVVYLASEASDYMVGHNLVIEGGQSLW
ncbi:hypothetical protein AURANDRAFT_30097, partial [Aureococcus anophagefferens]